MQEIFTLAYHLHWSRESIMALPILERGRYLELLADQLRRQSQAVQE